MRPICIVRRPSSRRRMHEAGGGAQGIAVHAAHGGHAGCRDHTEFRKHGNTMSRTAVLPASKEATGFLRAALCLLLLLCAAVPGVRAESLASVERSALPALPAGARVEMLRSIEDRPIALGGTGAWVLSADGRQWQALSWPGGAAPRVLDAGGDGRACSRWCPPGPNRRGSRNCASAETASFASRCPRSRRRWAARASPSWATACTWRGWAMACLVCGARR